MQKPINPLDLLEMKIGFLERLSGCLSGYHDISAEVQNLYHDLAREIISLKIEDFYETGSPVSYDQFNHVVRHK